MNVLFNRPRGTQDILPKDSYKWQFVEKNLLDISKKYGFKEIRVPTFEHADLFCRSVGDTSDIVEKEMYVFEDKSSRLIALRPEGTAGVIRAALENNLLNEALPLKVSYILSCFRYEKPESGRLREFHQFGVELLGSNSPQADYEVIEMAAMMLNKIGILKYSLNINSIGCKECREKYKRELIRYMNLNKKNLCEICQDRLERNPMRILDCKESICQETIKNSPTILDFLCSDCQKHFDDLKQYLDISKIKYVVDPKIVRGLDYYTKTVFEFIININGINLTVCGGGRYDNLISELGGNKIPAFGVGIGLERLIMVLDSLNNSNNLKLKDNMCDIYIITLDEKSKLFAIDLIKKLRSQGYNIETDLMGRSLKAQMKYANKILAKNTLVIGENEILAGKANLKNMETSEVTEFKL